VLLWLLGSSVSAAATGRCNWWWHDIHTLTCSPPWPGLSLVQGSSPNRWFSLRYLVSTHRLAATLRSCTIQHHTSTRRMYWRPASIQHDQPPPDNTVRKRFFRDNFVIFRRRTKRIAFLESMNFSTCFYMQLFNSGDGHVTFRDSHVTTFWQPSWPISVKCLVKKSPD